MHDLLVVDHYGLGARFERAARAGASTILVFDDLARPHVADVLVDGADAGRARAYEGLIPVACEGLAGPDYVPLRALVFAARANAIRSRQGPVRRLLVALGSGSTSDLTRRVVEQALRIAPGCRIDVVMGAGEVPHHESITVHRTTGRLIELMANADAAIGAGGVAAWERCALGLPSVAVVTAENQQAVVAALAAHQAAIVVGHAAAVDESALGDAVAQLIGDAGCRRKISRNAARMCDGLGAARLAAMLDAPVRARDGTKVRLTRARPADGEIMLAWQRDPRTRQYARNRDVPTAEEHYRWLERKLDDPDCILHVIRHGDAPAGVLRLDRCAGEGESWMISIYVAPEKYRLGIALAALALARRLRAGATLLAEVFADNAASQRLFRAAGFVWTGSRFAMAPLAGAEASP
jgi:spore coat polysaccharide biosynthesis predicted glycosyltransferase SpsG/RimJ/RimL family protein N-acetyltransferase